MSKNIYTREEIEAAAQAALKDWDFSVANDAEQAQSNLQEIVDGIDDIGEDESVKSYQSLEDWLQGYVDPATEYGGYLTRKQVSEIAAQHDLYAPTVIGIRRDEHGYPDQLIQAWDSGEQEWRGWLKEGTGICDIDWCEEPDDSNKDWDSLDLEAIPDYQERRTLSPRPKAP